MTSEPVSRMPDPKYAEAIAESRQDAEFWERKDGITGMEERLRKAMERVLPGPWEALDGPPNMKLAMAGIDRPRKTPFTWLADGNQPDHAEYLLLCHPDNILALLDALRTAIAERDEARAALAESDKHAEKIEALLEPHVSWEGQPSAFDAMKARAEAADARLEEQETSWRETLRIERDARLHENRLKMKATARLEEAKAVLGPFVFGDADIADILWGDLPDDAPMKLTLPLGTYRRARAFLHQGGEE